MSQDLLIDGKPLQSLRVVDLRDELKKRGIKSSGTKSQLQELLLTAITSEQPHNAAAPLTEVPPLDSSVVEANETPENKTESSNDGNSEDSRGSIVEQKSFDNDKVASISINEEKETIRLTIRSSPRKSEPFRDRDSETEDSRSEEMDSENSKNDASDVELESETKVEIPAAKSEPIGYSPQKVGPEKIEIGPEKMGKIADRRDEESARAYPREENIESEQKDINLDVEKKITPEKNVTERKMTNEMDGDTNAGSETKQMKNESKSKVNLKERLLTQKSVEEKLGQPVQRKRRWVGSQSKTQSTVLKGISSDQLNELINESVEENDSVATKVSKPNEEDLNEKVDETAKLDIKTIKDSGKVDVSFKVVKVTSQNGIVEDGPAPPASAPQLELPRSISPAKNPESTVLFITGLVRPYTLMQLKKLLSATGKIDEEKFWIDKIKSKCYVTYSCVEEAIETRKALHNLKWPQSSPKNLHVEFATLEDIDRCMNPENYKDLPVKVIERKSLPAKDDSVKGKYDIVIKEGKTENKSLENQNRDIREWDREKIRYAQREEKDARAVKKPRQPSPHPASSPPPPPPPQSSSSNDKQRKERIEEQQRSRPRDQHDRHQEEKPKSQQKEEPVTRRKTEKSESPGNLLEDLFRKTKTLPHIYWLPLSEEEAIERAKLRIKMEKEREARMAERYDQPPQRRSPMFRRPMRGRSPPRRRSPPPPPMRRKPTSFSPRRRYSRSPDAKRRFSPRRR